MSTTEYRYVQREKEREVQFNIYVKEMIEVIKNEEIKENLYVKGVKLSNHALQRVEENFGISSQATASRHIKNMLTKAKRIGTVLSHDGRINVLYAHEKTAIYLSPNLKTVVTISKYNGYMYKPILEIFQKQKLDNDELIKLHLEHLKKVEVEENEQMKKMLEIEKKVRESTKQYQLILEVGKGGERKKKIKEMISENNHELKKEGWRLFSIGVQKRRICKSIVSLI